MCDEGHEWRASVGARSGGSGCPVCAGAVVLAGFNDLASQRPDVAAEWHPTKNEFGPESVTVASTRKVWWMCEAGHEWQATVASRGEARGCAVCAGRRVLPGFNDPPRTPADRVLFCS